MRLETLMECAKILNTVDIDDPNNQKVISVSESYILHSYDLYKKNCYKEGYEPLSQERYLLEVLNLNEGILKKILGAAAVGATAYAAAKGVNYVNQQTKFNTQNGASNNGYNANAGFINNAKNAFNQAGGFGGFVNNARKTAFGQVGQEQIAQGGNVERTIGSGDNQHTTSNYQVGSKRNAKQALRNAETEYVPVGGGSSSNASDNQNQNQGQQQQGQEQTKEQQQNGQEQTKEQPKEQEQAAKEATENKQHSFGNVVKGAINKGINKGKSLINKAKGFFTGNNSKNNIEQQQERAKTAALKALQDNPNVDPNTIQDEATRNIVIQKQKEMKQNDENAKAKTEKEKNEKGKTEDDPKKLNQNETQLATTGNKGTQLATTDNKGTQLATTDNKGTQLATTDNKGTQITNTAANNNGTQTATTVNNNGSSRENPFKTNLSGKILTGKNKNKKLTLDQIGVTDPNFTGVRYVINNNNKKVEIHIKNGQIIQTKSFNEDYFWFEELPLSQRKAFLEANNIYANEYFVVHGVKYRANEFGNNWNRLSESKIFLEYLDICNDDEVVAFAKANYKKYELESGKINDLDFLEEAYKMDMLSRNEYIDILEDYSHSEYFYGIIDYICENWFDTKSLREPLTPSMRMPANYYY